MARPRSDDKREAILDAAARVIALQGLGAPTATIAREAGIANGSLFTYFPSKADLWNALFLVLKAEMAAAAMSGASAETDPKAALRSLWAGWLDWARTQPGRRKALALLATSDDLTEASRRAGHAAMAPVAAIMERYRLNGPMRDSSLAFMTALLNATADATIDFIASDPKNAERYHRDGFDALWRIIA